MGAATGGRHTATGATIIPTQLHTGADIMVVMVIIMRLPTITQLRELMDGNRLRMVRTDRQQEELRTILTPGLMREAPRFRRLMAAEVRHRPIILIPVPTLKPDRVRVQQLNGAAPTCRKETRALQWVITQLRMVP